MQTIFKNHLAQKKEICYMCYNVAFESNSKSNLKPPQCVTQHKIAMTFPGISYAYCQQTAGRSGRLPAGFFFCFFLIPETFVEVISLQSASFIFIVLILSAKSRFSNRLVYNFVPCRALLTSLKLWKDWNPSDKTYTFTVWRKAYRGITRRDGSLGPLPLQGSPGLLKAKQWSRNMSREPISVYFNIA